MRLVQDCAFPSPIPDKLTRYDNIHIYIPQELQTKGGRFNIIIRHIERGGSLRDAGKSMLGETGGQMPSSVLHVTGIRTWLASHERDVTLCAGVSRVGR